jgi:hypothetical protein
VRRVGRICFATPYAPRLREEKCPLHCANCGAPKSEARLVSVQNSAGLVVRRPSARRTSKNQTKRSVAAAAFFASWICIRRTTTHKYRTRERLHRTDDWIACSSRALHLRCNVPQHYPVALPRKIYRTRSTLTRLTSLSTSCMMRLMRLHRIRCNRKEHHYPPRNPS